MSDHGNGHRVSAAFVRTIEAWDTAIDDRPDDASRRAARFATPTLRHTMRAHQPTGKPQPANRWHKLKTRHGWVSVHVLFGGRGAPPPGSSTTKDLAVTTTPTDHGAHGWQAERDPQTWLLTLTRTSKHATWHVAKFKLADQ